MEPQERYRVLIRWRAADKRWEVETDHGGFDSGEEAALFANGLSPSGATRLWMARGQLVLELTNGRRVSGVEAVATWQLRDEPAELPEEARFERVSRTTEELSRLGLDGAFEPRTLLVIDPHGAHLAAEVEVDLDRQVVRVSVAPLSADEPGAMLIPRA